MPVKKGGTAMPSWFRAVRGPSKRRRPAVKSPRGMETRTMRAKLRRLRHRVSPTLGAIRSHTGCL